MRKITFFCFVFTLISCTNTKKSNPTENASTPLISEARKTQSKKDHQLREVKKAVIVPKVDGNTDDPIWKETLWYGLDQRWLGEPYTVDDFFGRYKMAWTPEALYLLVEIKDERLYDQHKDPLTLWWDDDCVEIFVDADNSGGNHQFNNNAFAYHVALDGNVVDLDADKKPVLYNNHITTKRVTKGDVSVWEFEILVFDDSYKEGQVNDPLVLSKDQKLGFAVAYNDNDGSKERENFIGSVFVPGEDKNQGWINADIFGTIILKE